MQQRRKAAALKYEENFEAPVVTAAGMGQIAENIIERAETNDIPIVYNKELTDLLCNVDIGDSIPSELYEAVAEVLAYVYSLKEDF